MAQVRSKKGRFFRTSPAKVARRTSKRSTGEVEVTLPSSLGVGVHTVKINGATYELRYGVPTKVPANVAQLLKDSNLI